MVENLASQTLLDETVDPRTLNAVRAAALFVSTLQPSESPSPDQVRSNVSTTLLRLGLRGCSAQVAEEFGDHADTAAARMRWSLAAIDKAYPAPPNSTSPHARSFAFAS